ncbi:MAG: sugar phosphate nucleotidyltransferase [Candidatus Poseidoniaceae archaeon]|jgi:glucose-1-phosphate thymidylyltransferase|nr:sugar phosphate nucleotidyltransferase [Candidatus Poseidoniaceae archaeon]
MKAIIVAGGHGSRLHPLTLHTHKTLLPLCGRPIIDYVLAAIRNAGIADITIIGNKFIDKIKAHVGEDMKYVLEKEPKGVAAALELARSGNEGCPLLIWFSDNISNIDLSKYVADFKGGAVLLSREVEKPSEFGIAVFDKGELIDIVEKPISAPSNIAIGGIYLFDSSFWNKFDLAKNIANFSISDVTKQYVNQNSVELVTVGSNTWMDCGTPEGLQIAAQMIEEGLFTIQEVGI